MPLGLPQHPDEYQMSFGEHLEELRRRIIRGLLGVGAACLLTFYYTQDLVAWLVSPLAHAQRTAGLAPQTVATSVLTGFTLYMKVGLVAAIILAGPWVLHQLYRFIAAGLYPAERRIVLLVAPFSAIMTVLGVMFAYYIMLPLALVFLVGFTATYPAPEADQPIFAQRLMESMPSTAREFMDWINGVPPQRPATTRPTPLAATAPGHDPPLIPLLAADPADPQPGQWWIKVPQNELRIAIDGQVRALPLPRQSLIQPMIEIDDYIGFVLMMILGVAVAFQVPVVMLLLGWTGLVKPSLISRHRKILVFLAFVAAAALTPTGDPFNLCLLALPLWALFEIGLIVMRLAYRRHRLQPAQT